MTESRQPGTVLAKPLLALHRRLLPDEREIGWTPYLWLIYLSFFFIEWFFRPVPFWELTLSCLLLALFFWCYFRSFWVASRRRFWLLLLIVAIGVTITPINHGGIVFYIYATATAGTLLPRRLALVTLTGIILVVLAQAAWLNLPIQFWLVGTVVGGFVGLANLYFAGVSSENASLRLDQEEVRALAASRERERISRDLHDLLGQSLSLISLKAQLARRLLHTEPKRATAELADIEEQARHVLQQVRDAVRGYRRASLASEAADARVGLGSREIEFDYRLPEQTLASDVDSELALVLREAVTNVLRHSTAEHCRLDMDRSGSALYFRFSDDGKPGTLTEGSGLSGMRLRIEALGGHLRINTDQGLAIEAEIPDAFAGDSHVEKKDAAA